MDSGRASRGAAVAARGRPPAAGTCDSCGLEAEDLEAVHRAYLGPDGEGELRVAEVDDGTERWCGSCRAHYPHAPGSGRTGGPVDGEPGPAARA